MICKFMKREHWAHVEVGDCEFRMFRDRRVMFINNRTSTTAYGANLSEARRNAGEPLCNGSQIRINATSAVSQVWIESMLRGVVKLRPNCGRTGEVNPDPLFSTLEGDAVEAVTAEVKRVVGDCGEPMPVAPGVYAFRAGDRATITAEVVQAVAPMVMWTVTTLFEFISGPDLRKVVDLSNEMLDTVSRAAAQKASNAYQRASAYTETIAAAGQARIGVVSDGV